MATNPPGTRQHKSVWPQALSPLAMTAGSMKMVIINLRGAMKWWENIGNMMGFAGIWENFPSIFKYLFEWKWWFPVSSWIFHRQIHLYISINLTMFHSYIKILLTVLVCVISPKYWIKLCELSHLATRKTFRMGTRIAKFLGFKLYDRAATVCRAVLPSGFAERSASACSPQI